MAASAAFDLSRIETLRLEPVQETTQGRFLSGINLAYANARQLAEPRAWEDEQAVRRFVELKRQIRNLGTLEANWDSYNAAPIRRPPQFAAWRFLLEFLEPSTPTPVIVPMPTGGVAIEWHVGSIDIEVEVEGQDDVTFLWADSATEAEIEGDLSTAREQFRALLGDLSVGQQR